VKEISNFNFCLYTDVLFGRDTEKEAGRMIKKHGGTRLMLLYGGGSVKKSGLFDRVVKSIKDTGLYFVEFGGVQPNPRRTLVEEAIKIAQEDKVDFVLALGGGSVMDSAKAIALALANDGEYWKFYNGTPAEKMAPVGTIHTLSATGSEMSRATVLVDDIEKGVKRALMCDPCRPVFAIMNPELTYSVSAYQTAVGAVDIFAHSFNRYFMREMHACLLADEFAEGLMRTVIKYAAVALAKPNDYQARAELMLAGSYSHNDLMQIGRSGMRGSEHPLEQQLSGHYDNAHGAGLAVVMPGWLQFIVDNGTPDQVARVAQFGVSVFGVRADMADTKAAAIEGIAAFRMWIRSLGMPLTLKELNIPKSDIPAIAKRLVDVMNGKVPGIIDLEEKDIIAIYNSVAE
jgi:alcohol dehydrogenase YqhD (iron-dependent ADH family)